MPGRSINVVLMPGEHFVGDARHRVRTLLGSCVSIALWQPVCRVGAMSHFVLAGAGSAGAASNGRYGEDSLELMLAGLRAVGVHPGECKAKVFGGGAMFDRHFGNLSADIGRRNGEAARAMLLARGIPIVSESLFDAGHRQIVFSIRTGEVLMRHVQPQAQIEVVA